ncbi:MAG: DivIVA domain-containing protein [Acidimicrobiia bacterium]
MPLTPIDVQQKTFGTALRGYDLDEVDDFLDDVVTSLKDYEQRLRDAQDRISTLELEMTDRGDAEGAIARALVAAQRSADSIVADAKAEAERIIGDARAGASELEKARQEEKAGAEAEISRIRAIVDDLRGRLTELSVAVGGSIVEVEEAIDGAAAGLVEETVEPAVSDFEEPIPAWEQPSALDEIDELADVSDDRVDADEDSDDSADVEDDSDDDDEDSEDADESTDPDGAVADDDETPVRPWEVG